MAKKRKPTAKQIRSQAAKRGWAKRRAEQAARSRAARKGWATRRGERHPSQRRPAGTSRPLTPDQVPERARAQRVDPLAREAFAFRREAIDAGADPADPNTAVFLWDGKGKNYRYSESSWNRFLRNSGGKYTKKLRAEGTLGKDESFREWLTREHRGVSGFKSDTGALDTDAPRRPLW